MCRFYNLYPGALGLLAMERAKVELSFYIGDTLVDYTLERKTVMTYTYAWNSCPNITPDSLKGLILYTEECPININDKGVHPFSGIALTTKTSTVLALPSHNVISAETVLPRDSSMVEQVTSGYKSSVVCRYIQEALGNSSSPRIPYVIAVFSL